MPVTKAARCVVIDTGGLVESIVGGIERLMAEQTLKAVEEADRVLLVVDSRQGCTPQDLHVADLLRRSGKPVLVVANKAEGLDDDMAQAEFHRFGFGEPVAISSAHMQGLDDADRARARRARRRRSMRPTCSGYTRRRRSGSPWSAARTSASRR